MENKSKSIIEVDQRFAPQVERHEEGHFTASFNFRKLQFVGSTEREAVALAVHALCKHARDGHIDPDAPDSAGVPPVQHVLNVLSDTLAKNIALRNSNREFTYDCDMRADDANGTTNTRPGRLADGAPTWGSAYAKSPMFARDNEVISGLATAIAALARVKEL